MNQHRHIHKELIDRDEVLSLVRGQVSEWIELNIQAMDAVYTINACEDNYEDRCGYCKHLTEDEYCPGCTCYDEYGTESKWEWDYE